MLGDLVPPGVAGGLELLDRDVAVGLPVELGQSLVEGDGQPEPLAHGLGRLPGPAHRAAPQGVERLVVEPGGERAGLGPPEGGEGRVGGAGDGSPVDADGERVADEEQLHGSSVVACDAVADLFWPSRTGPPGAARVVLVHGSLDRSTAFLRTMRLLDDCTVVRYDRRGYGKSLAAGVCTTFAQQVDDLAEVVAGEPAVVFGHSLGGVVALAFAAAHPELVPAVVAYEAPMSWQPWWPTRTAGSVAMTEDRGEAAAAEQFMRRMIGDQRWEELPERTKQQRRAEGPARRRAAVDPCAQPPPYEPAALVMPVIAAHGDQSRANHQETARALAAAVPNGELVVVPGAGHGVHLTHPAAVADLVRLAVPGPRGTEPDPPAVWARWPDHAPGSSRPHHANACRQLGPARSKGPGPRTASHALTG